VSRFLQPASLAVTEIRYTNPQDILSTPPAEEDAFVAAVHLDLFPSYQYWELGRPAPPSALKAGDTIIYDIKRKPTFRLNSAFHSIHFYFPRPALNSISDKAHASYIEDLRYSPAVSMSDPVMTGLAKALLPAFCRPEEANLLFVDHVTLAVGIHVASTYGGMKAEQTAAFGGLAPWQQRRALELMEARLDGEISISLLAEECGLSCSHFVRTFRKTLGMPPHRWLLRRRVERAKHMLSAAGCSLAEVALTCGFADQSHFTRVFTKLAGVTPGVWRKHKGLEAEHHHCAPFTSY
jgi:AraC-like DNA-binding protein